MENTDPKLSVVGIGDRLIIDGFRGEWDVSLAVKFSDGNVESKCYCFVRTNPKSNFNRVERRDDARAIRDSVRQSFADGEPVYVAVYDPGKIESVVRRLANPAWVIIEIDPTLFATGPWKTKVNFLPLRRPNAKTIDEV